MDWKQLCRCVSQVWRHGLQSIGLGPCMVLPLPSAKLNQSQQQVYTSITTPTTANEMFCINTTWHIITHCEMDDLFFWAYWKTGMRLCCQKFKWRHKFKNNTYPFLLVMLMPFPVRWLGGYLVFKNHFQSRALFSCSAGSNVCGWDGFNAS